MSAVLRSAGAELHESILKGEDMPGFRPSSNICPHVSPSRARRNGRRRLLSSTAPSFVERLESRVLLSTYVVTNHRDVGPGSLRDDVQQSNASLGPNTITFAVTGTITLTSGQLEISNDLTIIGPGAGSLSISGNNQSRVFQIDAGANVSISALTITGGHAADGGTTTNVPGGNGGAIYSLGALTLTDDNLANNAAGTGGTGSRDQYGVFGGAGGVGGAIYSSGPLMIVDSTINGNFGGHGGAGEYSGLTGAGGSGGGIYAQAGRVVIVGSTISNNHAGTSGSLPPGYIFGTDGSGGGICASADLTLVNSTVVGNAVGFSQIGTPAGGAGIDSSGALRLTNVTIVGNTTADNTRVGAGVRSSGHAVFDNTIIADNLSHYDNPNAPIFTDDVQGAIDPSSGYNLIGDGTGATGLSASHGNQVGGPGEVIDPKLAALGNYGGPTETMPPVPGSPAIDAGSNVLAVGTDGTPLTIDQRGMPRIVDATYTGTPTVDIGAVEAAPLPTSLVVTKTGDTLDANYSLSNLSLRDALGIANTLHGPETITFAPGVSGTISLNNALGPLELSKKSGTLTIQGPTTTTLSVDGQNRVSVLQVDAGVSVDVHAMEFASGNPATVANSGILTLANCSLGAAGQVTNSGTLTLSHCDVRDNLITNDGTLAMADCTVTGIGVAAGGGIVNKASFTLTDCVINDCAYQGGVTNQGTGTLIGCTITGNTGYAAGGVFNSGTLSLTGCTVSGSQGPGLGNSGTLALIDCTISGNTAFRAGGGIFNDSAGTLDMIGCTISGNTATAANTGSQASGGGIENLGTASLFNCTISGNTADGGNASSVDVSGGGIDNAGTLKLVNCTVANNLAAAGLSTTNDATGGGMYLSAGHVTLNNTIVAANHSALPGPGAVLPDDLEGAVDPTSGFNLIAVATSSTGLTAANHNQIGTAPAPIDAKLGPLADNGGPTQTITLLAGSPAIDAGSNALAVGPDGKPLLTDQRGYYRIFNRTVDIGAYEFGASPLLPGDADADGKVDFADVVLVGRHYGMTNATWADGDFNNDGSVGFDDLVILARNYGKSISLTSTATAAISPAEVTQLPKRVRAHHRPTLPS